MSRRRVVLGLTAEHALLLRNHGSARSVMRRVEYRKSPGIITSYPLQCRPLHATTALPRAWSITPPRPPDAHPLTAPSSHDESNPEKHALSHELRTLMRLLPHSVVVCTSTSPAGPYPHPHHRTPTPRAMTMSSFTSLALTPTPVVSFNIATPSRTFDAVEASRRFNIHVLSDDVEGARVADWLARGNAGGKKVFEGLAGECGCQVTEGQNGDEAPVLRGPGVLYVLRCELLEEPSGGLVRVRDHVIVLGEVVEILEGINRSKKHDESFGLLYADRRYRQLGSCITPVKGHG